MGDKLLPFSQIEMWPLQEITGMRFFLHHTVDEFIPGFLQVSKKMDDLKGSGKQCCFEHVIAAT